MRLWMKMFGVDCENANQIRVCFTFRWYSALWGNFVYFFQNAIRVNRCTSVGALFNATNTVALLEIGEVEKFAQFPLVSSNANDVIACIYSWMCVCIRPVGGLARHNLTMRMLSALRFSFYSFDAAVDDDDEIVISLAQHTSSTTNAIRARPSFEQHFCSKFEMLDRSFSFSKVRIWHF